MWEASDETLLAGFAAGDESAAVAFVRRFQARVYGLAVAITGDRADADEVAQEVFVRAWRYAASFDPRRGSVETWVLTITRTQSFDRARISARHAGRRTSGDELLSIPSDAPDVDASVLVRSDVWRVRRGDASVDGRPARGRHAGDVAGDVSWTDQPARRAADRNGEDADSPRAEKAAHRPGCGGEMRRMTCTEMHDLAPEMALGVLSGDERGAAIAHLESCSRCHVDLSALADAADQLLLVAPHVDPPPGFEVRVLARLAAETTREAGVGQTATSPVRAARRRSRRTWSVRAVGIAAAAVLMVVARPTSEPRVAASADVVATTGDTIGRAVMEPGDPARITIDMAGWASTDPPYVMPFDASDHLRVERSDGATSFAELTHRAGATWSATLGDSAAGDVVAVAVVDGEQRVWCSAEFDH